MALLLVALVLCTDAVAQLPPGFKFHGSFQGIGSVMRTVIGAGPEPGSQRFYASHAYLGNTLDIVATDPLTGKIDVFSSPRATEYGAWAMVVGPDRQLYIGTLPRARIMRLDWKQRKLVDLGSPSQTEQYIWQLVLGSDGKLYGGTFPNAKLVRFDPATGKGEDLGRMSEKENYARSVAADDKGFVYVGIGASKGDLVAYEIATGQHHSIWPADQAKPGFVQVLRGGDGAVYAKLDNWMRVSGWTATPSAAPPAAPLQLQDGRAVTSYDGRLVVIKGPDGKMDVLKTGYKGKPQSIFRIALGPDGRLYGSSAMPIHFFWADPNGEALGDIAEIAGGEIYSFLAWKNRLLAAVYSAASPVISYRPDQPWKPGDTANDNPWHIHYAGEISTWRPMSMIAGPQNKVYIGAVSGYGQLGGPLCVFDPETGKVDQYLHVVQDQSVAALAALPNGLIVGGTTVGGGGGSRPTQTEAKLFLWDPSARKKVFDVVPVARQGSIEALAVGKNGMVYGFAGPTMFVLDPALRKVIKTVLHPMGAVIYSAVARGPQERLYGLAAGGIFTVNERTHQAELVAAFPGGISGGFAIRGRQIFFTQGPQLLSYQLPE